MVVLRNAEKSSKKDKDSKSAAIAAEEPSAGQARQLKAEMKRAKAAEAERKAKGSYMQVPVPCDRASLACTTALAT